MAEPSAPPDATTPDDGELIPADDASVPTEPAATSTDTRQPRWRRFLVGFLVVLVCVLAPLSVMGVWLRNTVLHTDQFVDTLAPLSDDPDVENAVANRVTNALVDSTDLEDRISDALPARAKPAAPFITGGAEQVVHTAALKIAQSDQFDELWERMLRRAHTQVVAVLQGKGTDNLTTKNGQVVLRIGPVAEKVLDALQQRTSLFDDVDVQRVDREIVLVDSEDLRKAQGAVDVFDTIANYLPFVLLALLAIAIWLSGNRRRTILRAALGIALGMALLLIIFNLGRTLYLDALPASVNEAAATAVYDQVLSFLVTALRTAFVVAIIVAIGAWLVGPGRTATRVRMLVRREPTGEDVTTVGTFVGHYRNALRVLVVALGLVVLVALAHPTPLAVLIVLVLVLIGLGVVELLGRHAPAGEAAST
jgi:hypothetical protein